MKRANRRTNRRIGLAASLCAAAAAAAAFQAGAQERRARAQDFEFTLGFRHLQDQTTTFDGGTIVDTESSTGIGFGFDWRFNERWSAGATLATHRIDYLASIAVAGGGQPQLVANELDTQSAMAHGKRYFGSFERVAPYATAALGWVTIDTNIPTGPPIGYCWFDPWWGYECSAIQPTRTSTELGTAVGVGVRWDFSRRVFLDASIGREWIDFDNAHRPDFTQLRVAFGIRESGATR